MLWSSVGIKLYIQYCLCFDKISTSLVELPRDPCHTERDEQPACHKLIADKPACHHSGEKDDAHCAIASEKQASECCNEHTCQSNQSQEFKIVSPFLLSQVSSEDVLPDFTPALPITYPKLTSLEFLQPTITIEDPPVLKSASELFLLHEAILC
jgi:hypothetical protein